MKRSLPSLNALRAFEAAARLGRVNAAADELAVTPAAVSHQIKALEDYFGIPLFRREVRRVSLTRAGQELLPQLTEGFDRLAEACARIMTAEETGVLTVSAPPTFAAKWLVRRLQDFSARHPEITVRLDGSISLTDFDRDDVDIAIRFGLGNYEGLRAEPLASGSMVMVCAPSLLEGDRPLRTPDDLRHHRLLHSDWSSKRDTQPDWTMVLKFAGVNGVDGRKGPVFGNDDLLLTAAAQGQGVALVSEVYAREEIAAGRIVRLFDFLLPSEYHYWLVCPPAYLERPKVAAFRDWIVAETARDET